MILRIPNFIDATEQKVLVDWINANKDSDIFCDANMGGSRRTTRYTDADKLNFPVEAFNIRKRIIERLKLEHDAFGIAPKFAHGMVASYAPVGDACYAHRDPVWYKGYVTLHCNILIQAPEDGGDVIVNDIPEKMHENELFCYRVSEDLHGVTEVLGTKPRLLWIFGFCIEQNEWDAYEL